MKIKTSGLVWIVCFSMVGSAVAQEELEIWFEEEEEENLTFSINGSLKLQGGVFVPLLSDFFQAQENEAFRKKLPSGQWTDPCDPVMEPNTPCTPQNHGMEAGSLSMFRAILQLEGDWTPHKAISVHAIFRGVRSLMTDADGWAQMPRPSLSKNPAQAREDAREWVLDNLYNEFDLREFYLDAFLTDWLSFRVGRQQVTWGETGQYRLLDVVNPIDATGHFGPIESFEDTRIPLWIVKGLLEFPSIDHSFELVWVPGLDRPQDLVTVPLSFVGAWGPPRSNTPSPFVIDEYVFQYPENSIEDTMRIGFRWKGTMTRNVDYSLVYFYTHQLDPPIPAYYDMLRNTDGSLDPNHMERLYLKYPRQHIAGFSLDWTLDNPIGAVLRVEAAVEPNRTYGQISSTRHKHRDPNKEERWVFDNPQKLALSYAVVITRPTMIRFLNPTQNFLFNIQWMHSIVPSISEEEQELLVEVPGFDDWKLQQHMMTLVFYVETQYFNGFFTPSLLAAYVLPDSAFVSVGMDFRFGDHWRAKLTFTDFYGEEPYRRLGLFRDRDEINLGIVCQF